MRALLLDTSCPEAILAIVDDGHVVVEHKLTEMRRHAEALAHTTAELFERAGLTFSDVDVFGVGAGPGSFVGVRVGMSTAKGWAMGTGAPLVGLDGLFALISQASTPWALAAVDARRGELYSSLWHRDDDGTWTQTAEPAARSPEAVHALLADIDTAALTVVGNGGALLAFDGAPTVVDVRGPDGVMLAAAFARATADGVVDEAASLVPRYLRAPDAKKPQLRPTPAGV